MTFITRSPTPDRRGEHVLLLRHPWSPSLISFFCLSGPFLLAFASGMTSYAASLIAYWCDTKRTWMLKCHPVFKDLKDPVVVELSEISDLSR